MAPDTQFAHAGANSRKGTQKPGRSVKYIITQNTIVNPADVIAKDPEVIIGSWCGRAVKKEWIRQRNGWEQISAIRNNHIYEVKSAYILQPGPAALTEGLRQLHAILAHAVNQEIEQGLLPKEKTDAALALTPPQKPVEHAAV